MKRLLFITVLAVSWLCSYAQFGGSGSGTSDEPYLVTNAYQLAQMNNYQNVEGVYFKLMNDIDLTEYLEDENPTNGWQPIGGFKGTFDGNGKTISGLFINRSTANNGLFGSVTGITVKDLTIICNITSSDYYTGGVCGYVHGTSTFSNITIQGTISGANDDTGGVCGVNESNSTFSDIRISADINGTSYVGGVCGKNDSYATSFSNITVNGTITGSSSHVGGVCGQNGYFSRCSVEADVTGKQYVGGITGKLEGSSSCYGSINECYVSGTITGTGNTSTGLYSGGIVGYASNYSNICNNLFVGEINGILYIGGIVGYCNYNNNLIENNYSEATITGNNYVGGICGYLNNGTLRSNAALNTSISATHSSASIGRVVGYKGSGTIGTNGTPQGNRALSSTVVTINGQVQDNISDDLLNGRGSGKTTMKMQDTYVAMGWDFEEVWGIQELAGYPFLQYLNTTEPQTLTFDGFEEMTYGDQPVSLPAATDQGLALSWSSSNDDVASISNNTLTINQSGTVTITATQEGNEAYDAFSQEFSLTVAKTPLTVKAKSYTRKVGQANPTFSITYTGFVNNDNSSSLTTRPVVTCSATVDSPAGTYPIIVSGGASEKYEFNYVNGTLTIQTLPDSPAIVFTDGKVKELCVATWDIDGDGELSEAEAAEVTSLGNVFKGTSITSFNELRYFTGLTEIGNDAFNSCKYLTSVVVPANVEMIGANAFYGNYKLASVGLPEGLKTICTNAFYACTVLPEITIPNSVTEIGDKAFYYCKKLASVELPASLTTMGKSVFSACSVLRDVMANMPEPVAITSGVFPNSTYSEGTLHVPVGKSQLYREANYWKNFFNIVERGALMAGGGAVHKGGVGTLDIRMDNMENNVAFQTDIILPEGFSALEAAVNNANGHEVVLNRTEDGTCHLAVFSFSNLPLVPIEDNVVLRLSIQAPAVADPVETATAQNTVVADNLMNRFVIEPFLMGIEVLDNKNGDVNGDDAVDVLDVVEITNYITGCPSPYFVDEAADFTGDGIIDITDVVAVIMEILQANETNANAHVMAPASTSVPVSLVDGDLMTLSVGQASDYSALQMDVCLDEGLTLLDVYTDNSHNVVYRQTGNNCYRIIAYSASNSSFGDEAPLSFNIEGEGMVHLLNGLLATHDGRGFRMSAAQGGHATGISGIAGAENRKADVYTTAGQRMDDQQLPPGIYIVNGKKMVVK